MNEKSANYQNRKIGVVCMKCGAKGKHQMGGPSRLRQKEHCEGARIRPIWWIQKYPEKATQERARYAR